MADVARWREGIEKALSGKLSAQVKRTLDAWAKMTKEAWALTDMLGTEKQDLFKQLEKANAMRTDSMRQLNAQTKELRKVEEGHTHAMKSNRLLHQVCP